MLYERRRSIKVQRRARDQPRIDFRVQLASLGPLSKIASFHLMPLSLSLSPSIGGTERVQVLIQSRLDMMKYPESRKRRTVVFQHVRQPRLSDQINPNHNAVDLRRNMHSKTPNSGRIGCISIAQGKFIYIYSRYPCLPTKYAFEENGHLFS